MDLSVSPAKEYFDEREGKLAWPERCQLSDTAQAVNELNDLRSLILDKCDVSVAPHVEDLMQLLRGLLLFDPTKRISAKEALGLGFFRVEAGPE